MNIQCLKCKGRGFCGRQACPHIIKSEARFKITQDLEKTDFIGSSPTPFVGRIGYPKLHVGILSPVEIKEDAWMYDAPRYWAHKGMQIPDIVNYRSALINSKFTVHAQDKTKILEIAQEVGMASTPVDVEVKLEEKPQFRMNHDSMMAPTGPNANLKDAKITSNPKVHMKVEKVVSDSDLKAQDAVLYLYQNNFDENFLSKVLSIGNLGIKKDRKLVPTRWSITATDDMIGKNLIDEIKDYSQTDYLAYFGSYLGNYYLILMLPGIWSYELFEIYAPKASWNTSEEIQYSTDYEGYDGRKTYADNCAGGYYAARLPILERLKEMKKQSTILVFRFITGEYSIPLGVWVVREATRKSVQSKPLNFGSQELMIDYSKKLAKKKFGINLDNILAKSIILHNIKTQRNLHSFF